MTDPTHTVWVVTVHNKLGSYQTLLDFRVFTNFIAANRYYKDAEDHDRMTYISEEQLRNA